MYVTSISENGKPDNMNSQASSRILENFATKKKSMEAIYDAALKLQSSSHGAQMKWYSGNLRQPRRRPNLGRYIRHESRNIAKNPTDRSERSPISDIVKMIIHALRKILLS